MSAAEQGANQTAGRWLTVGRTLCFVVNQGAVLLLKRGPHKRIFPNRYNGVGGHIERDEDVVASAQREILEETGLHVTTYAWARCTISTRAQTQASRCSSSSAKARPAT